MTLTLDKTGERLDAALARLVPSLSRSQAQRLIEQGAVTHGGRPMKKNEKLSAGDTLELTLPGGSGEVPIEAQPIPLEVCYEDADVIVVNKPKGLVVHPAPGHADGTLVNALLAHCGDSALRHRRGKAPRYRPPDRQGYLRPHHRGEERRRPRRARRAAQGPFAGKDLRLPRLRPDPR